MYYEWDWEGAERELRRAIELNPGYAHGHKIYAFYLSLVARFDEAVREIERARELDPLSLRINREVGTILYYAGHYDRAIAALQKTIEMEPNTIWAHLYLGAVYLEKSMYHEALAEFQKEREVPGGFKSFAEMGIGCTYALMGKRDEARKALENLLQRSKEVYVQPISLATVYFALGETDLAFEWLDKAYEERDFTLTYLKAEPIFRIMASDPRYAAMLKKIGLDK
jgi:tetratricopeptide (TPR) repeat protein